MSRPEEYRDRDHIKSYVRRAHRMSRHQRDAYLRLRERFCVSVSTEPIDPAELFPVPQRPTVLEIGFGMGRATAELAGSRQQTNFLGVEVYTPGVGKLLSLIETHGLDNVRLIHDDAIRVLEQMIAPGTLAGIHLFFPDPWPKKRHHKRRIIRPALTALMQSRLASDGYLYMVTDWEPYAEHAREVLEITPGLTNPFDGYTTMPWRPRTAFEAKGRASGRPIRELYFTVTA